MDTQVQVPLGTLNQLRNTLNRVEQKLAEQIALEKKFLNISEAASYLKISQSTLYKLTSTGKIKFFKPSGKLIYFRRDFLDDWVSSNKSVGKIRLNQEDQIAKDWVDKNFQTGKS